MTTTAPPPAWAIQAAGAALARAEIFDDRMTADRARTLVWAEAFTTYGIEQADAMAAVTAHYQQPAAPTPKPGDVIELARKIRRDRAEREKVNDLPAIAPPDSQVGGLPIAGLDDEPVWSAYEQYGAITRECRTCGAPVGHGCVNTTTQLDRKIPCIARITDGIKAAKA